MALQELPTRSDVPAFSYAIELDLQTYRLGFTFNDRMGKWFLSLADQINNPIIGPVPLTLSAFPFKRFKGRAIPPGDIFLFDTSGKNEDPGRYDLGSRVILVYESVNE